MTQPFKGPTTPLKKNVEFYLLFGCIFVRFGESFGDMFGGLLGRLLGHDWDMLGDLERFFDCFREGFGRLTNLQETSEKI